MAFTETAPYDGEEMLVANGGNAGTAGARVSMVSPSRNRNASGTDTATGTPSSGSERLHLDFLEIQWAATGERRGTTREILRGVNGRLRPGRLTAILGPSGAGKTSLLSVLSGNRTSGARGRVLVNGCERSLDTIRQQSVLIAQEFALLGALSVEESLRIAVDLRLGRKYSEQDRQDVVRDIVAILGLESCLKTPVKRLSGGERKRVSIGVELVTNPPVMFFDEPTSGLDSVSSAQVISYLQSLARAGHTVAVVLHQPSSRLFQLFDDLLLMSEGRTLYCGAVDQVAAVMASAGFLCPSFYNLADFVIEVASGERGQNLDLLISASGSGRLAEKHESVAEDEDAAGDKQGAALTDPTAAAEESDLMLPLPPRRQSVTFDTSRTSSSSPLRKCTVLDMEEGSLRSGVVQCAKKCMLRRVEREHSPRPHPRCRSRYPVPFWVQFTVLLKRSFLVAWRDFHMAWLRFAAHVAVALLLGFLYRNIGHDAAKITGNAALLFFFVLFLFFSNAMPTVLTFPLEAAVFLREHGNNWYSLTAYYLSKVIADLPFLIVNATLFLLVAHYLTDQPTDNHRLHMLWLVCLLTVVLAHAYGLVLGAAAGMQLGVFLVPASSIPLILFSGFFLYLQDIPIVFRWLSYVSNFRYGFEGAVVSVYGMKRAPLRCSVPYCQWKNPTKFLEDIGMENAEYWFDVGGLLIWIVLLQISLLVTLKARVYLSRR